MDKNKIKLICLPYAGGSANIYRNWFSYLNKYIELFPVELAGKGARFAERPYSDVDDAVSDIFKIIKEKIKDNPYILFGHSMGALLTYELIGEIKKNQLPEPIHVFYSGRRAPHIISNDKKNQLNDKLFADEILRLGGTPEEVLRNRELFELFIPKLRQDYKLIEEYTFEEKGIYTECDISILTGIDDIEVNTPRLIEWGKYTSGKCEIISLTGGHFFINDTIEQITGLINMISLTYFVGRV